MSVIEVRLTATILANGSTITKRRGWPCGGGILRRAVFDVPELAANELMEVALVDDLALEQFSQASLEGNAVTTIDDLAVPLAATTLARTSENVAPGPGLNLVLTNRDGDGVARASSVALAVTARFFVEV